MPYGSVEWGYGRHQLHGQPKATGAGTGTSPGDTLYWDSDVWKKCISAGLGPYGFNGNLDVLTQTLNVLTNATTYTRGSTDDDTTLSVIVSGRITKKAEAGIKAGDLVMPSSTGANAHTHVMKWDGAEARNVIGRYVINVTKHHQANEKARDTLADDLIKIDVPVAASNAEGGA